MLSYTAIYNLVPRKKKQSRFVVQCTNNIFMYIANSRSAIIGFFMFWISKFIMELYFRKGKKFKHLFYVFIVIALIIPFVYMLLYTNVQTRTILNDLSWKYLRKRFYSGRQILWGFLGEKYLKGQLWGTVYI